MSEQKKGEGLSQEVNSQGKSLPDGINSITITFPDASSVTNDGLPKWIDEIRNEILNAGREKIRIPGVIFVTDIVSYYFPYSGEINDFQRIKGELYHRAIQSMLSIECRPEVGIEKEFEGYIIKGRVDLYCDEWLGEIKGSRSSQKQGALQLQLYDWILGGGHKLLIIYSDLTYEIVQPNPQVEDLVRRYIKAKLF